MIIKEEVAGVEEIIPAASTKATIVYFFYFRDNQSEC